MKKNIELLADETLSQKLIKKWFRLYFFGYLTAPLGYLVRLFISNSPEVSVADFGVMYSIISLVTFLWTYNDLWLTESLRFFLPRFYLKKEYNNIKTTIRLSLWVQILTWIIIAAWLWFGSSWLSTHYFHSEHAWIILKYFCAYFILTNIFQVIQTIFYAFQRTFETQIVSFIQEVWVLLFVIFCFFSGRWNIERYSLSRILWTGIAIIAALLLYKRYRWNIMQWKFKTNKIVLNKYVKYALWAFLASGIGTLFGQIIQQMVLYFLGAENAWYYSNFLSLFYIWTMLVWPILWLIFPVVSELVEKKDHQKLWLMFSFFYNYFSIFILSFSVLFITLWSEISIALFGEEYLTSGILLSQTGIFLLFSLLSSFNYGILGWMWKVKERVYITWISCILMIISAYILIKLLNIRWAWFTFWLGSLYTWWWSLYVLKKEKYSLKFDWKFIIRNILLFIALWVTIYLWKKYLINADWNRWYMIIRLIIIGLLFYWIIAIWNLGAVKKLRKEILNLRK